MRVRSRARPRQSANQGVFVTPQAVFFGYFLLRRTFKYEVQFPVVLPV